MYTIVYPGSFDPMTIGHINIIKRLLNMYSNVIVAIGNNVNKNYLFSEAERLKMLNTVCDSYFPNSRECISISSFHKTLAEYLEDIDINLVARGIRNIEDIENEFKLESITKQLNPKVDFIFIHSIDEYRCISSSFIKNLVKLNSRHFKKYIPDCIQQEVLIKIQDYYQL